MEIYGFIDGVKKSLTQLAADSGVSYDTLLARYKAGVPFGELTDVAGKSGGVSDEELAKLRSEIERFRPNLLDNSDFSNPVNQKGATSYSSTDANSAVYTIDRWMCLLGTLTIDNGYVNWKSDSVADYKRLIQKGGTKFTAGKTYTLAMLARVNAISGRVNMRLANNSAPVSGASKQIKNTTADFEWFVMSHTLSADVNIPSFDILVTNTASDYLDIDIKAAAIYEGEYTVDTLPEYHPKGYNAELAICSQYNPLTGVYKGAYSMDLLWKNASPTSSFSGQTITVDLSGYDFYLVTAMASTSSQYIVSNMGPVDNGGLLSFSWGDNAAPVHRSYVRTSSGIQFYGAYYNKAGNQSYLLPYKIYGIKGVG